MSHRAPWAQNRAAGQRETLPRRTPGASSTGWAEQPSRPAFVEYIRMDGPELCGEADFPPPPEVLGRVLDGLRELS
ncbi:MAG: hypothetical protein JWL68_1127 [Actinomycetia bacterium]|nr:hypothetical protein [Actinomycetes bacterium]